MTAGKQRMSAKPYSRSDSMRASCLECYGDIGRSARPDCLFCTSACRIQFNQRRLTRGATLYDLVMALHDPGLSRGQTRAARKALVVVLESFWTADTVDVGNARYKPIDLVLNEVTCRASRLNASEDGQSLAG